MKTVLKCSTILVFVLATGGRAAFAQTGCDCNGDVNGNGVITIQDRTIELSCVGCSPCGGGCVNSDVNCDGTTDYVDVGVVDCQLPVRGMQECCSKPFGACSLPLGHSSSYPDCLITLETACQLVNWGTPGVPGTYAGDGTECVAPPAAPANDACAQRFDIQPGSTPFTNVGATIDGPGIVSLPQEDCFFSTLARDIWYEYVPTFSGDVLISLCQATDYDAVMVVYGDHTGTCSCPSDNGSQIACNDEGCTCVPGGSPPRLAVAVVAGECYLIRVAGFPGGDEQGTGTILVEQTFGTISVCDDDDDCTVDSCDPATGCVYTTNCGNGTCDPGCGENCSTCAADCPTPQCNTCIGGVITPNCDDGDACTVDSCDPAAGCVYTPIDCGDGTCDPDCENCCNCPEDCGCGPCHSCNPETCDCTPDGHCDDGTCDPDCGENCSTCASDCPTPPCNTCIEGVITPNCGNGTCEPDCGENCGTCPRDCPITACTQVCEGGVATSACRDGTCDPVCENCCNCPEDCGCGPCQSCNPEACDCAPNCGNRTCEPECGENCSTCASDCSTPLCNTCIDGVITPNCGDGMCDMDCGENCSTCAADCPCDDGNACTTETCQAGTCTAATYSWSGVLQPINADGSSIFKLGGTVPTKFRLTGPCTGISTLTFKIFIAQVSGSVLGTELEPTSTSAADTGNTFRYSGDQYIFNLATKTLSAGTWQIRIAQYSGSTELVTLGTVNVSLKK